MKTPMETRQNINVDDMAEPHVDEAIATYLSLDHPVSFFLFAGAGSGKTRSLVTGLESIRKTYSKRLLHTGKRVAVITYTNKAAEEISSRLAFDPLIQISTIHHFVWSLIKTFQSDIKRWLESTLVSRIAELKEQQQKGRRGTKAYGDREEAIAEKTERLLQLHNVRRFVYSPSGDNSSTDSLNHSEVIRIGADFLANKPLLQQILVASTPILLIDESQDTNGQLVDALFKVQGRHKASFCLGLIGDTMQRIYTEGKVDLGEHLPDDWATPFKQYNHRSPRRIVELINKIRFPVDGKQQIHRRDAEEGIARLFVVPSAVSDKLAIEALIREKMSGITKDPLWQTSGSAVKTLILEHHMAAARLGFSTLFDPVYKLESLRPGLLDGSLAEMRLFTHLISPIVTAHRDNNSFAATAVLRKYSPLLSRAALKTQVAEGLSGVAAARVGYQELTSLWQDNKDPQLIDVLLLVHKTGLFEIPIALRPLVTRHAERRAHSGVFAPTALTVDDPLDESSAAWEASLAAPFSEVDLYHSYISGQASFDTHQGVKGLEFDRVLVIMDDAQARGFTFSYEKLFTAKDVGTADHHANRDRAETGLQKTQHLLYVTCSRAKKSLALVAYSEFPDKVREYVVSNNWFALGEVEMLSRLPAMQQPLFPSF